jgi:hypothetical protein
MRRLGCAAAIAAFLLPVSAGAGPNLIQNGTFAAPFQHWSVIGPAQQYGSCSIGFLGCAPGSSDENHASTGTHPDLFFGDRLIVPAVNVVDWRQTVTLPTSGVFRVALYAKIMTTEVTGNTSGLFVSIGIDGLPPISLVEYRYSDAADAFLANPIHNGYRYIGWTLFAGQFSWDGIGAGQATLSIANKRTSSTSWNTIEFDNVVLEHVSVAEPASLALLGAGLFGLAVLRRRPRAS